jgi:hypothetical protein
MENDFDSTTSTPPSLLGVQSDHSSTMPMPRSGREAMITKLLGADKRVNPHISDFRVQNNEVLLILLVKMRTKIQPSV